MIYAADTDMIDRFGASEVSALSGISSISEALQDASEELDTYVARRYTIPLPIVPAPLKRAACDIARYRMYKDRPTEEVKARYEQVVKWLVRLSDGKVVLNLGPTVSAEEVATLSNPVVARAGSVAGAAFSDTNLNMMPSLTPGGYR